MKRWILKCSWKIKVMKCLKLHRFTTSTLYKSFNSSLRFLIHVHLSKDGNTTWCWYNIQQFFESTKLHNRCSGLYFNIFKKSLRQEANLGSDKTLTRAKFQSKWAIKRVTRNSSNEEGLNASSILCSMFLVISFSCRKV